jgi:hypothetical protein
MGWIQQVGEDSYMAVGKGVPQALDPKGHRDLKPNKHNDVQNKRE